MRWSSEVEAQVSALKQTTINDTLTQKIVKLLDYTSLNDDDTESSIAFFSEKAHTSMGDVAAVCVYPRFVRMMATEFANTRIKVATVANFPQGTQSIEETLIEINDAIEDGAQEIDVVFPYHRFLLGESNFCSEFVTACKDACGSNRKLKVILESGVYKEEELIKACEIAIDAGANFLKTSTGKIQEGASLQAAATILLVIKRMQTLKVGIKISGGVKTLEQATEYMELADHIMGKNWINPNTFRIGTSKLIDEIAKIRI